MEWHQPSSFGHAPIACLVVAERVFVFDLYPSWIAFLVARPSESCSEETSTGGTKGSQASANTRSITFGRRGGVAGFVVGTCAGKRGM